MAAPSAACGQSSEAENKAARAKVTVTQTFTESSGAETSTEVAAKKAMPRPTMAGSGSSGAEKRSSAKSESVSSDSADARSQSDEPARSNSAHGDGSTTPLGKELEASKKRISEQRESFEVDGETIQTCAKGDGAGIGLVAAGKDANCGFAMEVFSAQQRELPPRAAMREQFSAIVLATDPESGKEPKVNCYLDDNIVKCTGEDGQRVYMY